MAVKELTVGDNAGDKYVNDSSSLCCRRSQLEDLLREIDVLSQLDHPHIARYLGAERDGEVFRIFMEYVGGGSLNSLIKQFGSFEPAVAAFYTRQLLSGLQYLHKKGIAHRDIKGANVLLDHKGHVKLTDFGCSKKLVCNVPCVS